MFFSYIKNYKFLSLAGPFLKFTETVFELLTPLIMARIIDRGIAQGDYAYIWSMGGLLLALAVTGFTVATVAQYFAARASMGIGHDMRGDCFKKILAMPVPRQESYGTASLTTRVTTDINQVQNAYAMFVRLALRTPAILIGAVVMTLILDWQLGLIFVLTTPLVAITVFLITKHARPLMRRIRRKIETANTVVREHLRGVRIVRAFSNEESEQRQLDEASAEIQRAEFAVHALSALTSPVTFFLVNMSVLAILWFGGVRVNAGEISPGTVVAMANYASLILLSVTLVAHLTVIFTRASVAWKRVKDVLNEQSEC